MLERKGGAVSADSDTYAAPQSVSVCRTGGVFGVFECVANAVVVVVAVVAAVPIYLEAFIFVFRCGHTHNWSYAGSTTGIRFLAYASTFTSPRVAFYFVSGSELLSPPSHTPHFPSEHPPLFRKHAFLVPMIQHDDCIRMQI